MMKRSLYEIREVGEDSGRDEAADEYPYQDKDATYREIYWRGRGRAQSLYKLRGRDASVFAQAWATGYQAFCSMVERVKSIDAKINPMEMRIDLNDSKIYINTPGHHLSGIAPTLMVIEDAYLIPPEGHEIIAEIKERGGIK
jgi:hypothetical protein